ncbi:MAG TPA: hypothetical protein VIK18_20830 [Pirellulales bacterium]
MRGVQAAILAIGMLIADSCARTPAWLSIASAAEPAERPADVSVALTGRLQTLAFTSDGKRIACFAKSDGLVLVDTSDGRIVNRRKKLDWANSLAVSGNGKLLATGSNTGHVGIWSVGTLEPVADIAVCQGSIYAVAIAPDGAILASCAADGTVQLWDIAARRKLRDLGQHGERMQMLVFSPDGKRLASTSRYGRIGLWEVATGKLLASRAGRPPFSLPVTDSFGRDGKSLLIGSYDEVVVWDFTADRVIHSDATPEALVTFDAADRVGNGASYMRSTGPTIVLSDQRTAATVDFYGRIALWDLPTRGIKQLLAGTRVRQLGGGGVEVITCSSDGRLLAAGNRNGRLEIWRLPAAAEKH